jgi:uncharacterized protein YbaR (Trm112 family)
VVTANRNIRDDSKEEGVMTRGRASGRKGPAETESMLDKELLEILACPETKEPVALASDAVVAQLNARIEKGELKNRGGEKVADRIEAALVRHDGKVAYPVRDGIPIMLVEEGIALGA